MSEKSWRPTHVRGKNKMAGRESDTHTYTHTHIHKRERVGERERARERETHTHHGSVVVHGDDRAHI